MEKIKLNLGNRLKNILKEEKNEIIDTSYSEYIDGEYIFPTLKDVATILYCFVGHGVTWNLIEEIANRLELPLDKVEPVIENIIKEYYDMSIEEAEDKFHNTTNLCTKLHSDEYQKILLDKKE